MLGLCAGVHTDDGLWGHEPVRGLWGTIGAVANEKKHLIKPCAKLFAYNEYLQMCYFSREKEDFAIKN